MSHFYVLGNLTLLNPAGAQVSLGERRIRALFAFLMVHRDRAHSRDTLIDVLYPESLPDNPGKALRQALWRLRSALKDGGLPAERMLVSESGVVRVPRDAPVVIDAETLADAVIACAEAATLDRAAAARLQAAVNLYRGEPLPGFYEDWAQGFRDSVHDHYATALRRLVHWYLADRQFDQAVSTAKRLVGAAPLSESAHRLLMSAYAGRGDRAMAVVQFRRCCATLSRELNIPPAAETTEHYQAILATAET